MASVWEVKSVMHCPAAAFFSSNFKVSSKSARFSVFTSPGIRCISANSCFASRRLQVTRSHRKFSSRFVVHRTSIPGKAVKCFSPKRFYNHEKSQKLTLAALEEDSAFLETKIEDLKEEAEKSKEAFNEAVNKLKDAALKLQVYTKSAYAESAEKTLEILRDTSEQLKKRSEIAVEVLTATAQETTEKGKENLSLLAETAPDPIKDVAAAALDAHFQDKEKTTSRIHDFCLGIPYGGLLVMGGLFFFLLTESTAALRYGVLLGGFHLYLSIKSLKVWKQGKSSLPYIKGQAAITLILFVRELRRFSETKLIVPHAVMSLVSASMLGFYTYVYLSGGNPPRKATTVPGG